MSWPFLIEGILISLAAAKAGYEIYESRVFARPLTESIRRRLKAGHIIIGVIGAGGTGKSTLGRLLAGTSGVVRAYEPSSDIEEYTFSAGAYAALIVAPGQERYWKHKWPNVCEQIKSGKKHILINVVSYGYHGLEKGALRDQPGYRQGMSLMEFAEEYARQKRQVELEALREIEPHLRNVQGDLHILTLVTKQDVWWEKREEVLRYYTQGEYNTVLQTMQAHHGDKSFGHDFLSASLVRINFRTPENDLLAPTAAGYDEDVFQANMKNLLKAINEKCSGR